MRRMARRKRKEPVGQEAPMVITPRQVARLLRQIGSEIRRKASRPKP